MREILEKRSELYRQIRSFFDKQNFLEVETPLLLSGLIPESSIEIFHTVGKTYDGGKRDYYLPPSPEVMMKMLLAAGSGDIYQICKSFRNCEEEGPHHSREFTMLEWYKTGISAIENISLTEELLAEILPSGPEFPLKRASVDQMFIQYAGFSLAEHGTREQLAEKAQHLQLPTDQSDTRESLFNKIFLTYVEPELKNYPGIFLYNYPSFISTLAKQDEENPLFSERWELYLNGVETANCYTEETDFELIEKILKEELILKDQSLTPHPLPPEFLEIFRKGLFPRCSGVAMGLDRLLLLVVKRHSLKEIIPHMSSIINRKGD